MFVEDYLTVHGRDTTSNYVSMHNNGYIYAKECVYSCNTFCVYYMQLLSKIVRYERGIRAREKATIGPIYVFRQVWVADVFQGM